MVKKNGGEELEPVDVGLILDLIDEGDEKALRAYADSLIRGSLLLKPEAARR